jgi:hypothetical protein
VDDQVQPNFAKLPQFGSILPAPIDVASRPAHKQQLPRSRRLRNVDQPIGARCVNGESRSGYLAWGKRLSSVGQAVT